MAPKESKKQTPPLPITSNHLDRVLILHAGLNQRDSHQHRRPAQTGHTVHRNARSRLTFGLCITTGATQLCTCSFGNSLHFGFTSAFENTEVQRRFFELLADEGIEIEIRSNEYHEEEETPCSDAPAAE